MTWRRFTTLLRGLGPASATFLRSQIRHLSRTTRSTTRTITDPKEITDAFATIWGTAKTAKRQKH